MSVSASVAKRARQTDHEGRAQAMQLIIETLMRCWCHDPDCPTRDEMRAIFDEAFACAHADFRQPTQPRA